VLFVKWANAEKTRYITYEESGSKGKAISREVPYPFMDKTDCYKPVRLKNIC